MNTIESRLEKVYSESKEHLTQEPIVQTTYLVNGELREAGATELIQTPLTVEGTYGYAPSMSAEESLAVLASSKEAWNKGTGVWPMDTIPERVKVVCAFVEEIKTIRESVVTDLMYEIAKNRTDAEKEFDRTVEYIELTCEAALKHKPIYETHPGGLKTRTDKMPLGETLCMSPYNYPLNETFTTFIPSLVMGNPTILKPARHGVLFRRHFAPLFQKYFPAGSVNMIYGDGETIVTPQMESGDLDSLAFIGSSGVAKKIAANHPNRLALREVYGLGAKNAYIVTKTAEIDKAVKEALVGAFSYNGQRCTANKMLFVAREIRDVFMAKIKDAVEKLTIGMPYGWYTTVLDDNVYYDPNVIPAITPFPEPGKVAAMHAYIEDAKAKGARIVNKDGGKAFHNLMVPAILEGVTSDMRIYHEEQFGSVLPVAIFDDIKEPIERIRNSEYGQQVSIYSTDQMETTYFFNSVSTQQGRININSMCQRGPDQVAFSATKGSAVGTLSIEAALLKFSRDRVAAENPTNGKYFFVNEEGETIYLPDNH